MNLPTQENYFQMNARIEFQGKEFLVDLANPEDISMPVRDGLGNPNCYGADPVEFETIQSGNFIGSLREGGNVNHKKIHLSPHGNGTHTECYAHIVDTIDTINSCLTYFHFSSELISVSPAVNSSGDRIITLTSLQEKISASIPQALIVRTLPNPVDKKTEQYTGSNPPYFESEALAWMARCGILHLITDLPSVDKEKDDGKLAAHHAFWNTSSNIRKEATLTELAFIRNEIEDGLYFLNLQIISLELDVSPSKPILYKLTEFF